jgi:hypothetical protein
VVTIKQANQKGNNKSNNKEMKRLVAGFCAVGMLATISADEPVTGWNLARWGMTTAQIQAVYPNTKTVKASRWHFDGRTYHGDLALAESIRVGGYDFKVRFLMDDSERLAGVQLTKEFVSGDSAFNTVKQLLIQRYGKPTVETNDSNRDITGHVNVHRKSVWQSAKAQIRLGYISLPLIRWSDIILSYEMPGDTDKVWI